MCILFLCTSASAFWPNITAKSWLVADDTGKILQGENTKEVRDIASITKLMTAMVVLDAKQDLNEKITNFTRGELIQLALVKSDNNAARLLCENYPKGDLSCVAAMNEKAKQLGMINTHYHESTGLSIFNISTAEDLIKLVQAAEKYPEVRQAASTSQITIKIKNKWFIFHNTNSIIGQHHNILVSKTGFINMSGGCIVMMIDTDIGKRIVVVLGSKNTHTRIPEAEFISKIE